MQERDFQLIFNKYLKANYYYSGAFELKITHKDSIPFSDVKQHQIESLQAVENHKLVYKISDSGIGFKPFDCICLQRLPAYVVVLFYQLHSKDNRFYAIRVNRWIEETIFSTHRKSLTRQRASEICEFEGVI